MDLTMPLFSRKAIFVVIVLAVARVVESFLMQPISRSFPRTVSPCITSQSQSCLFMASVDREEEKVVVRDDNDTGVSKQPQLDSPVLQKVYPALAAHYQEMGHANLPLGTPEGRACQTLRRLYVQQKLSLADIAVLEGFNFTWHSMEDVYRNGDFDEFFTKLVAYMNEHDGQAPPKKYAADPELGAWVAGVRRLGPGLMVDPEHQTRLDAAGFAWVSPRQCGSQFMIRYRDLQSRVQEKLEGSDRSQAKALNSILEADPTIGQWIRAQQETVKRGALSETRKHYMERLVGTDWLEQTFEV